MGFWSCFHGKEALQRWAWARVKTSAVGGSNDPCVALIFVGSHSLGDRAKAAWQKIAPDLHHQTNTLSVKKPFRPFIPVLPNGAFWLFHVNAGINFHPAHPKVGAIHKYLNRPSFFRGGK